MLITAINERMLEKSLHLDLVAIRRAFMRGGRERAITEMKRRFPWMSDNNASELVDLALTMEITQPAHAGRRHPRRDGPR